LLKNSKKRIIYLDYYRAFILLLMIQGHMLRELLTAELKTGPWFKIHEFIHGAVAPGFLFLSGILFFYTIKQKKAMDLIDNFYHYIGIIILGYFIHLPFLSLRKIIKFWEVDIINKILYMDILQTIGFSLIISMIIWIFLRKFFISFAFLIIAFNIFHKIHPVKIKQYFFSFFFDNSISQFPLFHWSIYFFLGVLASRYIKGFKIYILIISLLFSVFPFLLSLGKINTIIANTGMIFLLLSLCQLFLNKQYKYTKKFLTASKESLFLYASHIMIIYGSVLSCGLSIHLSNSLSIIEFITFFTLLSVILYVSAFFINKFRIKRYDLFALTKNFLYFCILVTFFLK